MEYSSKLRIGTWLEDSTIAFPGIVTVKSQSFADNPFGSFCLDVFVEVVFCPVDDSSKKIGLVVVSKLYWPVAICVS